MAWPPDACPPASPRPQVNTLQATRARAEQQWQQQLDPEARQLRQPAPPRRGAPPPPQKPGGGTLAELSDLVREGGWAALFSGIEASLIGTTVSQGIYFYL